MIGLLDEVGLFSGIFFTSIEKALEYEKSIFPTTNAVVLSFDEDSLVHTIELTLEVCGKTCTEIKEYQEVVPID